MFSTTLIEAMTTVFRHLELVPDPAHAADALSDSEVIAGLQLRDPRVAAILYDRLFPVVDRTVRRIFHERVHDHDDLVQTIFEQILRSILQDKFSQSCSLSSWATLIASRVAIDALRSRIRERRVVERSNAPADLSTVVDAKHLERRLEARSEVKQLQVALTRLNSARQEAVLLHDVLGHSLQEVAKLTGIGIRAAQSRLFRGRKELLAALQPATEAEPAQ